MRVVSATSMNKQSSRSHAIFTIYITIKTFSETTQKMSVRKSKIHLVDLAGSERADKTNAKGQQLKEGSNINKSLTYLGLVIEKLAKNEGNGKKAHIPYRNSQLTYLLSHSLGGNSKTIMIAAISPALSNYEETKSTLMFAERVSVISNESSADVQEEEGLKAKLMEEIRRLREELAALEEAMSREDDDEEQAKKNKLQLERILTSLEMKQKALFMDAEAKAKSREKKLELDEQRKHALEEAGVTNPEEHKEITPETASLINVSDDPTLAGMLVLYLHEGNITIGSDNSFGGIKIKGLGINPEHCTITNDSHDIITITAKHPNRVLVNGNLLDGSKTLSHKDRIVIGHGNAWQINIPKHPEEQTNADNLEYGDVMNDRLQSDTPEAKNIRKYFAELEERIGEERTKKFAKLFAEMLDMIDEANEYSSFRYKRFPIPENNVYFSLEVMVDILDYLHDEPEFAVRMRNKKDNSIIYLWDFEKFTRRVEMMAEWYEDIAEDGVLNRDRYFDPWIDSPTVSESEQKQMAKESLEDQLRKVDELIRKKKGQLEDVQAKYKDHIKQKCGKTFTADETELSLFREIYFNEREPESEKEKELETKFNDQSVLEENKDMYNKWILFNNEIDTTKLELKKLESQREKILEQIKEQTQAITVTATEDIDSQLDDLENRIELLRKHNTEFDKELHKVLQKIQFKKKNLATKRDSGC